MSYQEILNTLPPATQNNSRQIVRKLLERFAHNKSDMLAHKIESMTGFCADHSDGDYGTGARGELSDYKE